MLGANDTHAWLALATLETPRRQYSAVLDLATGCFTESVPQPVRVSQLEGLTFLSPFDRSAGIAGRRQAQAEAALADPATQSELRSYLGLAARFGRHSLQTWAWSTDGSKILALPAEGAFRSRDGGQSFEHVDSNMSRSPFVTRDGRWAFYERCSDASVHNYSCPAASREVAIFATADAAPPRHVPLGRGTIAGLDPTGQKLVIIRDDEPMKVTVMHVEPQAGNIEHAFSIPARALPKNKFFTIDTSRGGRYGTYDSVDYPVTKLTLVSMVEKRAVHTFQGSDFGNVEVDEEGRIAWWGFSDKHTHAAPPTGVVRDLGAGEPVGWASGGRLLMYEYPKPPPNHPSGNTVPQPPGTLGENACKLVRVRSVLR